MHDPSRDVIKNPRDHSVPRRFAAPGKNEISEIGFQLPQVRQDFVERPFIVARGGPTVEVLRQMPREPAAHANHAIERHCGNGLEVFHREKNKPRMNTNSHESNPTGANFMNWGENESIGENLRHSRLNSSCPFVSIRG